MLGFSIVLALQINFWRNRKSSRRYVTIIFFPFVHEELEHVVLTPFPEHEVLRRVVSRSADLNLPYLASQSLQSLAGHYLLHPRDSPLTMSGTSSDSNNITRPEKVWELLRVAAIRAR